MATDQYGEPVYDPNYIPVPEPIDADGTRHCDVGLPYEVQTPGTDNVPATNIDFSASQSGGWAENSQWWFTSNVKGQTDYGSIFKTGNYCFDTMTNIYAPPVQWWSGNPGDPPTITSKGDVGNTAHMCAKITDYNDGAKASGNLYMTFHYPDEYEPSNIPTDIIGIETPVNAASPGFAIGLGGIDCTWNTPGAFWGHWGSGVSALGSLSSYAGNKWLALLLAFIGGGAKELSTIGENGTCPWCWGSHFPDSTYDGISYPPDGANPTYYIMYPHLKKYYDEYHLIHHQWDMTGYVSATEEVVAKERITGEWYGAFQSSN